ncbi:hypothetical protein NE237_033252 [Protea cynaroides]|uniref:Uncharacterized protein n=1 Tax=Protea cynaroides TaxID=273540 RepID=A0A9Q0L5A5_9MAGN|nr:hypothetical protein NE237_033252 [Protea cynaroides]
MNFKWVPSYGGVDLSECVKLSPEMKISLLYGAMNAPPSEKLVRLGDENSKANSTTPLRAKVIIVGDGNLRSNFNENIDTYTWKITPIQGFNFMVAKKLFWFVKMCGEILAVKDLWWVPQVFVQWSYNEVNFSSFLAIVPLVES